jgi:hypothetical protein
MVKRDVRTGEILIDRDTDALLCIDVDITIQLKPVAADVLTLLARFPFPLIIALDDPSSDARRLGNLLRLIAACSVTVTAV